MVRSVLVLPVVLCGACLAAPPASTEPDGQDCMSFRFDDLSAFSVYQDAGCQVEAVGSLRFVQEASMPAQDGCYVETLIRFDGRSASIRYGGENGMPMTFIVYGDQGEVDLTRWGSNFEADLLDPDEVSIGQRMVAFDDSWRVWRIEWDDSGTRIGAGSEGGEIVDVMTLDPLLSDTDLSVVLGSWPGELPGPPREASFDDLELCR